jgi:hypothetical protein
VPWCAERITKVYLPITGSTFVELMIPLQGINDDVILNCCTHYCDAKMDVVNKLATGVSCPR